MSHLDRRLRCWEGKNQGIKGLTEESESVWENQKESEKISEGLRIWNSPGKSRRL